MTQTTADTLRKAKALISDPVNWNKDGGYYKNDDYSTGCMCVYGAISTVYGKHAGLTEKAFNNILLQFVPANHKEVTKYNDHPDTTHADIMALFDRAIELAEKETNQ